jgi:hypothetical protein
VHKSGRAKNAAHPRRVKVNSAAGRIQQESEREPSGYRGPVIEVDVEENAEANASQAQAQWCRLFACCRKRRDVQ